MLVDFAITPVLPVTDLERARRFYELTLGLRLLQATQSEAWYQSGNGPKLHLCLRESLPSPNAMVCGWEVANIEREVRELKRKGVAFEELDSASIKTSNGIANLGLVKRAWFKDTEGNTLVLSQPLK